MGTEHAHEDVRLERTGRSAPAPRREDAQGAVAAAADPSARFTPATVSRLQGAAGSLAISRVLAVQRHAEGDALLTGEQDAAEVSSSVAATAEPPAETRSAADEKTQTEAATKAGGEYEAANKLSPGAQSLASAQKVLQGAFGGMKTFVTGKIEILADQAACSAKYDEVCIRDGVKRPDGSQWKAGDKAKDDLAKGVRVQGFAWKGVVYVNGATTLVTATAHEMLHVNTSSKFRKKAGETINEGTTEYFARKALKASGVTVPATTAYPKQVKIVEDLIALVGEDALQKAYFNDVEELIKAYKAKSGKKFDDLRKVAEALDTAKIAEALKPKT